MAAFTSILIGVGLAVSAAGTVMGMVSAQKQAKAQKEAIRAQRDAEALRKRQMDLEASRKRRDQIRQFQVARAQAVSNATNQGAAQSSGLAGGLGTMAGQVGQNVVAVNQNQQIGAGIFDANMRSSIASEKAADAGTMAYMGQGITSLGGMLVRNAATIGKIGGWA